MHVMNFLAAHPTERFGLSDLAHQLSINVASLHTVLATLTAGGYLERDPRHRTYKLGPTLVAIGTMALAQHPVVEAARDEGKRLSDRLELDVAVFARAGTDVTVVAHSGMRHAHGLSPQIGERMPLRPPLGSIFYAWSDAHTIEDWLSGVSEAERPGDRDGIAAVAQRGFSVSTEAKVPREGSYSTDHVVRIDQDQAYRVSSICGPVFDTHGAVALTIALVGFPAELRGTEVLALGVEVRGSALLVTKRTRGTIPSTLLTTGEPRPALT
jgi:DNA-binding IclR family transcriptional regulator